MGNVVVVGSINVDLHLRLHRHILPGETLLAEGGTFSPGGKGANQALAARLAGANVVMLGAVGRDDATGGAALRLLDDAGVRLDGVSRVAGPSGLAVVSVDAAGENTVVVVPGANAAVSPELVEGWGEQVARADVVILQGEISAASNVAAFRHARGRVLLNLAPVIDVDHDLLRAADPLVVNETEGDAALDQLGGSNQASPRAVVEALLEAGVRSVVMTLGARGSLVGADGVVTEIPTPRVPAVDTVGAGDAYCGALAARLAAGESLLEGARYASRFAAYCVQLEGAQTSYPHPGTELPEV